MITLKNWNDFWIGQRSLKPPLPENKAMHPLGVAAAFDSGCQAEKTPRSS
jgi:hypothetical protein